MSQIMSSMFSMPTEMRIVSSPTPAAARSSGGTCWWVVLAGWITRVLASPTLARWLESSTPSMKATPASYPPATPKVNTDPGPAGVYLRASSWLGWEARPG